MLGLSLLAGLPTGAAAQTAQTFVSNLGQADGAEYALSTDFAMAFTTGSNSAGYSLRSVEVEFSTISNITSSQLTASIHSESSGSPGSSLGTLTNPAFTNSNTDQVLTFTSTGIDLAANTTYFLVIDMSSNRGSSDLRSTDSNSEDSGNLAGWSIGNNTLRRQWNSTGAWATVAVSLKISLGGVVKPPFTLTLSIPDDLAVEDDVNNEAQIRVALSRALVSGETVTVPLNFAGASRPADFNLLLGSNFTGVSLSGNTVTFTGPSVAAATMNVLAVSDSTDDDETLTVSLGTVTSTGVTVASSTRSGNGEIRLLETVPYTASPGPPLVIVDSIIPVHGSCTGRECETTEVPAGNDIIINARLVRPALEKGVGFIPVAATRQIVVNAYVQPGVHAHQWLTAPTFAVGEKSKTWLLRMESSTAVESDVRRMVMFSGPVGDWDDDNPPPYGVIDNDPYYFTIKDGPDGTAGNLAPTVTVEEWLEQKLDGGVPEGQPAHFLVRSASAAQGPFTVHLKVEQTAGDCVAAADRRVHTVSFAPQVGSVAFSVPTVDDSNVEQDCTVKVSLARANGTVPAAGTTTEVLTNGRFGYTIDTNNDARLEGARTHKADATATVRDDDSVARKVSFVTNSQQVKESTAGRVDLVVAVDPAPSADFDLNFSLSGNATRGSDYTVPTTVTVASGATRATIPVTIVDDSVEDSGEWVTVKLLASGGYQPFSPVRASIKILNHEPGDGAPDWTDYRTVVDHLIEARDNPENEAVRGNPAHVRKLNRVLAAIGHASGEEAMPASEIHANAANWPDSPFWAASVYLNSVDAQGGQDQDQPRRQEPEVAVTAGAAVTEGGAAVFTFTASPAPSADLAVGVTVGTDGDWGVTAGERTVTIPASGSATLTLATAGDDADEPDGSVSVTATDGSGYTVGSSGSGTVSVLDDDDPAPPVAAVDPALVAQVRAMAEQTQHGQAHVERWRRVLVAFGVEEYPGLTPTTLAEAQANAQKYSSPLWPQIAAALADIEAAAEQGAQQDTQQDAQQDTEQDTQEDTRQDTQEDTEQDTQEDTRQDTQEDTEQDTQQDTEQDTQEDTPPVTPPTVSITAGDAVTEGGSAVFTLTASPAPAAALPVTVEVAAAGAWGVAAGTQTVSIPTSGSATLTLATTDDDADEADGSVTLTLADGEGYAVGSPASGSVVVQDDDEAPPPPTLSVSDARAREGYLMTFTVRLSAPAAETVRVVAETRERVPVSASGQSPGRDYYPKRQALQFRPGQTERGFDVLIYDDDHDDAGETFEVALSDAEGAVIADAVGIGTIENDDPLPRAWLGRFGRTGAAHVVDLLGARFETAGGGQLTLGGQAVDVAAWRTGAGDSPRGRESGGQGVAAGDSLSHRMPAPVRHDGGGAARPMTPSGPDAAAPARAATVPERALWQALTRPGSLDVGKRFLSQSSFHLSLSNSSPRGRESGGQGVAAGGAVSHRMPAPVRHDGEAGAAQPVETVRAAPESPGRWSLWGRGALTQFQGADAAVRLDGETLTGLLGLDYARERWLAGVALAWHDGDGAYRALAGESGGELDSTLITVNPYLRYALTPRLSVWGTVGYGTGSLELTPTSSFPRGRESGGQGVAAGDAVSHRMPAPVRHDGEEAGDTVRKARPIETDLGMSMGAVGLRGVVYAGARTELAVKSDALWVRTASGDTDGLRGAAADTRRIRLLLSGQHRRALANDALLSPSVELGLRYDGGGAETGVGMELGGGLRYADALRGLTVETRARALIAHEDNGYEEWGIGGSLSLDPGRLGRGLALRLASGWGVAQSNAEALWQRRSAAGLAPRHTPAAQARLNAELGYGLDVPWTYGVLTPYGGMEWAGPRRALRLGWRFDLGQRLSLRLEGERLESGYEPADHSLVLRTTLPW